MRVFLRTTFTVSIILALLSVQIMEGQEVDQFRVSPTVADCTDLNNPDQFPGSADLHRKGVSQWKEMVGSQLKMSAGRSDREADTAAARTPRKSFVSSFIFRRVE